MRLIISYTFSVTRY